MKKYFLLFLSIGVASISCSKNDDEPVVNPDITENPIDPVVETKSRADYPVQDFMWQAMNLYYFYVNDVPNLDEGNYATLDEYVDFIASESNPADFYNNKLLFSEDRFSFLNEDYKTLTAGFSGISKSNGLEYSLARFNNSEVIYGYVRYIVKNSDAATKDIKRGDLFTSINGEPLFFDSPESNNTSLLRNADTYTLGMADFDGNEFVLNGKEVTLTKQEGLVEDPILVNKVLDVGGQKVGYLMYNQFAGNSGEPLNDVFGEFKSEGISDLVLDLRYNPGGLGYITQILGSLIHQPDPLKLFYTRRFNSKYEEALEIQGGLKTNFVADTGTEDNNSEIPLNSLDLNKIYVIATGNSASASELLINGLRPYVEVVHIGSTTVGKNQGSFTLVDSPATGFGYNPDREDEINPNNSWAIQPITSQTENSEGFGDYSAGLPPTIPIDEDFSDLGELGNPTERLLARALQEINGVSAKTNLSAKYPVDMIYSSSLESANGGRLIFRDIPALLSERLQSKLNK
ncbi:S41 family peptidase [Maribacter sp. 2307UL18-2]|uniref:S41 family peptidase n=1 Tax=Maribacter sp. 2307UL18-2 TaxID=3386274 RepID=UPI0039BD8F87